MADFNIDVGFQTKAFTDAFKGSGSGVDSGTGGVNAGAGTSGIGKGFLTALKATGIIALLMNLKIIVDLLGGMLAILNLGVLLFLKGMFEFFKDPARGLLQFGVFLINGFITAIESLANLLVPSDPVQFDRLRGDVIQEQLDSGAGLLEALSKGFMSEEEYQTNRISKSLLQEKSLQDAHLEVLRAEDARKKLAQLDGLNTTTVLAPALDDASSTMLTFLVNVKKVFDEANDLTKKSLSQSGIDFAQSRSTTSLSSAEKLSASRLQSTIIKEQDARAFNYLTGLGR